MMKNTFKAAMLALAFTASAASAQTAVDERLAASRDGTVKVTNLAGSVRVTGWDRDTVAIAGTLGSEIERLAFESDDRATKIRVVPIRESRARPLEGSDLEIRVPRGSHVAVRTWWGDIRIENVQGGADLESTEGDIRVRGAFRAIHAQTAAGNIDIDATRKGVLRVKSVGGDITVRGAGGYIDVSTVSGSARVEGRRVWEGRITSVSGDIRFSGDFERDGSFEFESNSGTIELVLPSDIAADFDIISFSGLLETDFPADTTATLHGNRREYVFNVGGKGTHIKMKTYKGRVRIRKKP